MTDRLKHSPRSVCVLGMHRSGTSTITRAINLLGAYLGEEKDLMPPMPDNPEGFWERLDIADLDDKILRGNKMSWDTNMPLRRGWHLSADIKALKEEAAGLIEKHFAGRRFWAWKDPRTTVLFDLWKEVVKERGVELGCLFAVRNPLDVAMSVEKRDGIPRDRAYGIWFNYNISGLLACIDIPTVFVSYDRFLSGWEGELKRCAAGLGIPWPQDDTGLKSLMNSFIRPDLRHSRSGSSELKEAGAPEPVIELYGLLEGLAETGKPPDKAFFGRINELYDEFYSYARFYYDDETEFWELKIRLREFAHQLAEKDARLAEKDAQLAEQCAEQDRQLAEKGRLLAERDRHINALMNSWSWKLTAPMRAIARAFFSK